MQKPLERILIEQCAPTLSGLKPASLFRCVQGEEFIGQFAHWTAQLAWHGLTLRLCKTCGQTGERLLYLYWAGWLFDILDAPESRGFLREMGYRAYEETPERLLDELCERLCLAREFPHEIGLFLGYPLCDVIGFIAHKGQNYTYCGYWKAYGDPAAAQERFAQIRSCTARCRELFAAGVPMIRLIAAS